MAAIATSVMLVCSRVLRELDNAAARFLLDSTVQLLRQALPADSDPAPDAGQAFGTVIALDTKHILAWVKENNPKQYVEERYAKTKQPKGDPDCKLGCKKRHNKGEGNGGAAPATPTAEATPASQTSVGEYHRGYASGVVSTKVPDCGEFVLAELTQTFDKSDPSYFFPLMAATERRLGHRPPCGALDKAFDAFYVYQYFHEAGGFAAVPFSEKGGLKDRGFNPEGLPLCAAGLPMPLKFAFTDRASTLVVHERGKYVCPRRHPQLVAHAACPVNHKHWAKGGCTAMMPTCAGARIRYQLERDSPGVQGPLQTTHGR